jgi:hypothetical protein
LDGCLRGAVGRFQTSGKKEEGPGGERGGRRLKGEGGRESNERKKKKTVEKEALGS